MRFLSILTILSAVFVCSSQTIGVDINGFVKDSSGTGVSGAKINLEKSGLTTTSGADGSFSLKGSVTGVSRHKYNVTPGINVVLINGNLKIDAEKQNVIEISEFDLHGKCISRLQMVTGASGNSFQLPARSAGVYFYRIKTGSSELLLKRTSTGDISKISVQNNQLFPSLKKSKVSEDVDEVITVLKNGFLDYHEALYSYSEKMEIQLVTCNGTLTDIDGNVYQMVKIGNQIWTVENLKTTKYNDGTPILFDTSAVKWGSDTTGRYCYYNNTTNVDSIKKFGALYNWYVVNTNKIAPSGWHIPTHAEWDTLTRYLISNKFNWDGSDTANKIGASVAAKTDWAEYLTEGKVGCSLFENNRTGFAALPGGFRKENGTFLQIGTYGFWWSSTHVYADLAFYRQLQYDDEGFYASDYRSKKAGFSIKLLKN